MLSHLLTFLGYCVVFGSFIPPLVIWQLRKDGKGESAFVTEHAKEALNFQINMVFALVLGILMVVSVVFACIGIPYLVLVGIADIVFVLIAAIKAHNGESYRYPFAIRIF